MDADSPLSNIDADEVIADSEDEGHQKGATRGKSIDNQGPSHGISSGQIALPDPPTYGTTNGQIDYFAGFQENMLSIPSIAERAKTRQRKTKAQPILDILELTDEDELMLKPETGKPKKKTKPKEKKKKTPVVAPDFGQGAEGDETNAFQTIDHVDLRMVNAKPKVRPRPTGRKVMELQSPPHRTSQTTIPIPTSPFPLPWHHPPSNTPHLDLPPSDPPSTSSMFPDRRVQLPPIEFLPPMPMDSDTPLPSSLPGENIDELQAFTTMEQSVLDNKAPLPQPPPTFFAGSSSSSAQVSVMPAPTQPPPPASIIDLTDIPTTLVEPTSTDAGASGLLKTKRPRKPRKKKGEESENVSVPAENIQATKNQKKGRKKAPQVTVEVLLPLPTHDTDQGHPVSVSKRKGKQKQTYDDPWQEDELNIGASHDSVTNSPAAGPSSPPSRNDNKSEDFNRTGDSEESSTKSLTSDKRERGRKKALSEPDGSVPMTAPPKKRKKVADSTEEQKEGAEEGSPAMLKSLKRRKKGDDKHGEEAPAKAPQTTRITKSRGRMIIASDDEDNALHDAEDLSLSPKPQETGKGKKTAQPEGARCNTSENASANEGDSQDDQGMLKHIQPADVRRSSFDCDKTVIPSQRHQTPSVGRYPSLSSRYTIAPKTQTSSMSELLRRVNSHPSSPFSAAPGRSSPLPGLAYSPYLKSSRRVLSRIAPLHPNRKTPPPPLPPPPPKKKSKKELELEEKWEEEIIEEIGGITEWLALSGSEKAHLKRMKRDKEMGYCEE